MRTKHVVVFLYDEKWKQDFLAIKNELSAVPYDKILRPRGLIMLGAMCCHADIINYGELHYTDFIRTKTLCQGGDYCDFFLWSFFKRPRLGF